jgi:hypothetical protein
MQRPLLSDITNCQLDEIMAFTTSLDSDIESSFKKVMMRYLADPENRFKIEYQLKLLFELRSQRLQATAVCQNSFETMKAHHRAQLELFCAVADVCKAGEVVRLHQREADCMTQYHQRLNTVIELIRVDQIAGWCSELTEISTALASTIQDQKEIQTAFELLLNKELGKDEVSRIAEWQRKWRSS